MTAEFSCVEAIYNVEFDERELRAALSTFFHNAYEALEEKGLDFEFSNSTLVSVRYTTLSDIQYGREPKVAECGVIPQFAERGMLTGAVLYRLGFQKRYSARSGRIGYDEYECFYVGRQPGGWSMAEATGSVAVEPEESFQQVMQKMLAFFEQHL